MLNLKKLEDEGRLRSFTFGMKSCINTGNYSSKAVTIEYTIDKPTVEEIAGLKELVKEDILAEENIIFDSIITPVEVVENNEDEIKLEGPDDNQ